jgi:hypothetical protein
MFSDYCFYLVSKGPKCGLHNIDDEICCRSKPGFVFHDSRGVEVGSATELSTVQQFVEERSLAAKDLQTQLHVIWYQCCCSVQHGLSDTFIRMCLPLDECRELFESEREIFQLLKGTGEWQREAALRLSLIDKS